MLDIADQTLEDALAPLSVLDRERLGDALARMKQRLLTMTDREPAALARLGNGHAAAEHDAP